MGYIARSLAAGLLGGVGLVGCEHTETYDTDVPMVEEFVLPPNEDRFDNPRELGYTPPPPKVEFKPQLGGGNGPGSMGGGPGRGGF